LSGLEICLALLLFSLELCGVARCLSLRDPVSLTLCFTAKLSINLVALLYLPSALLDEIVKILEGRFVLLFSNSDTLVCFFLSVLRDLLFSSADVSRELLGSAAPVKRTLTV